MLASQLSLALFSVVSLRKYSLWADSLNLPLYLTIVSVVILLSHILWESKAAHTLRAQYSKVGPTPPPTGTSPQTVCEYVGKHGGLPIFSYKFARLVGCLVLLSLSVASLASQDDDEQESDAVVPYISMALTHFYASVLAVVCISSLRWRTVAAKHLNAVLILSFGVYCYRDVFPLATFTLQPLDRAEGALTWTKISFLFAVSCLIPLAMPRQHTPVDLENPLPPSPEQTASLLSLTLYFFMDHIIFLAYRIPHLGFDQLPPLCDYDHLQDLKTKTWKCLDVFSGKKRHIAFGIMWTYRWAFVDMSVMLVINGLSAFISPIGINRLLSYLENPSQDSFMKPWFWILLLFVGPLITTLSYQRYVFVSTHIVAQTTAIITQLVFEHALRIRIKSDVGDKDVNDTNGERKPAAANLLGRMTNLVTTDLGYINEARNILLLVILVPIQIIGAVVFLYQVLGWRLMLALFPVPGYVSKLQQSAQKATLAKTDARVQTVSEIINVMRMIKMFGWEKQMNEKIAGKREEELDKLWIRRFLDMFSGMVKCTAIAHQELTAAKVFSSMGVFDLLRSQIYFIFYCISATVNGKVSLDRLEDFLHNTELLDSFNSKEPTEIVRVGPVQPAPPSNDLIGFRDASFSWSADEVDGASPSSRKFLLKVEGELFFKPGCVNLVVGPTGSGKTSLLMALLGEMHLVPSFSCSSWYNLPRGKGVSFAAQESFVLNDTIRNNILFNTPMDEARYNKVLYQCCLERDLELLDAGDMTEVGEKGLTLSGGQKARVTLARAIYARADIILLDDVLAALDVHTAKWIVEKCLSGDLVKHRTVVLVTHNVVLASQVAGFVVSVGSDGRVHGQDTISDALKQDEELAKEVSRDQEMTEAAEKEMDDAITSETEKLQKKDGKLIVAEEIALGNVSWKAINMYFQGMGGNRSVPFFALALLAVIGHEILDAAQTWYLGYWASQYALGPVPVFRYLGGYSAILLTSLSIFLAFYLYFTAGTFRASRTIHKQLVESMLGTTLRWLDSTPTSRIITRCTVDISTIDSQVAEGLRGLIEYTLNMLTKFFAVVLFTPVAFFAGGAVGILGAMLGRIYMASQLSTKREQSNARAPVLAHFTATMAGLASVRAYDAQDFAIRTSMERIDRLSRATRTFSNVNRWVTVRIDLLGGIFASLLAYYIVYLQNEKPANIGFSLNMALGFSSMIFYWVRILNAFEVQGNSLERIHSYLNAVEQEPKPTETGIPPAYWPASGNLSVDHLSARYSKDGPNVLHNISFTIKSGEKVGVVGRTGSGKSSLTLALLRCILTDGTVYYDGVPTHAINLDALRSNITVIPQVPELLVGTLRSNLDMFQQFDDATLNNALRSAGLASLQEDMDEGKLTLDSEVSAGGSNLSVGQRQIIALARAIVRGSKLMILDEDYKTDAIIQNSLRTELPPDTTCLIVAHRLHSVMDVHKIMVLDAGRMVEFGSPRTLLENKSGLFRALVYESGDRDALLKMVPA
ncbi:ATP-binding cassette transporter [Favolaschia claudopus]|uniref:ATP-binding cassette transporter n=1 Tax=Favolaschia claudopus TaxID=2862362 RepID=A0AAW0AB60_9AGAR